MLQEKPVDWTGGSPPPMDRYVLWRMKAVAAEGGRDGSPSSNSLSESGWRPVSKTSHHTRGAIMEAGDDGVPLGEPGAMTLDEHGRARAPVWIPGMPEDWYRVGPHRREGRMSCRGRRSTDH